VSGPNEYISPVNVRGGRCRPNTCDIPWAYVMGEWEITSSNSKVVVYDLVNEFKFIRLVYIFCA